MDKFAYVVNKSTSLKEKRLTVQALIIDLAKSYDVEAIRDLYWKKFQISTLKVSTIFYSIF